MTPITPTDAKAFLAAIDATARAISESFAKLPPDLRVTMIELEPHLSTMRRQLLTTLFEEGHVRTRRIPPLTFVPGPFTVTATGQ